MRRVLDSSGLSIDRKTYYNLMRNKPLEDGISNNSFEALVLTLEEAGFRFLCNMSKELVEDNNIMGRILNQVVFLSDQQIVYAKRFIAD